MIFKNISYIYEVYKERNFTKAAKNLYITQPSLSAAIKRVEDEIGMAIFDRSTSPIELTECGRNYMECVEDIMAIESRFKESITNMTELKAGRISIGGSQYCLSFVLPEIVKQYTREYPYVEVILSEATMAVLEQQLYNGMFDMIFTSNKLPENIYDKTLINNEYLLLTVPKEYAVNENLAGYRMTAEDVFCNKHKSDLCQTVPLNAFENENFILLSSNNSSRHLATNLFEKAGIEPRIMLQVDHQFTAYMFSNSGIGVTLISDTLIKALPSSDKLYFYKLPPEDATLKMCCCYKHNTHLTPAMKAFIQLAKEHAQIS